jgi:hypothetical protein
MDLVIHGVYDAQTLKTLQHLSVHSLGFDLRGRHTNLIPFHLLKALTPHLLTHKNYLIFENDKVETVKSFLSLLGEEKDKFEIQFRDIQSFSYYASIHHSFSWFYHPEGDWESILSLPHLKSIVLPVRYKNHYQNLTRLWDVIGARNLQVILHVDSFSEVELYVHEKNLTLSVDLGKEVEMGFRQIDQARLTNLRIWRMNYESASGQ